MRIAWIMIVCLLLLAGGIAAMTVRNPAQATHNRVPVTIAVVAQLPYPDTEFVILRRPASRTGEQPDVILLSAAHSDEADLTAAVDHLQLLRRQFGDTARYEQVIRLRHRSSSRTERSSPLPWAGRVIGDIRRADVRALGAVGSARAVDIWLPRASPSAGR